MYIYLWLAFVLVFHAPFKEVSLKGSQFFLLAISLNQHTTFSATVCFKQWNKVRSYWILSSASLRRAWNPVHLWK